MSTEKTTMAGQEKPKAGPRPTKRNAGTTININTVDNNEPRHTPPKTQQHTDTAPAPQTSEPQTTPKPPIYDTPQVIFHGHREAHYATPLAATLFARFDENYTGVQPCEFAVFEDLRLKQRGYI